MPEGASRARWPSPCSPMRGMSPGIHGEERADANQARAQSKDAASHGEHQAFGEQLANDASAGRARARMPADGDFALPARRADQQEVGDIRTRDQQDEADCAGQNQQGGAHVTDEGFLERADAKLSRGPMMLGNLPTKFTRRELQLRIRHAASVTPGLRRATTLKY